MSPWRQRARARLAVATVVGGTLLVALLVTWSASIGTGGVLDGEGPGRLSAAVLAIDPGPATAPPTPGATPEVDSDPVPAALKTLALCLIVIALAIGVSLVVRLGRVVWGLRSRLHGRGEGREANITLFRRRRRGHRPRHGQGVAFDVVEASPARAISEQIVHDTTVQRRLLLDGEPGDAIIACWQRFETQAARAGITPQRWETSSEFALRILDLAGADSAAVLGLAEEFWEARFSTHVVTEQARARAAAFLTRIHDSLDRRHPETVDA